MDVVSQSTIIASVIASYSALTIFFMLHRKAWVYYA
jgi:hypothetical protein